MNEDARVAKKVLATPAVHLLADRMRDPEDIGLWEDKGKAGLFLAAYAALAGKSPTDLSDKKDNEDHKTTDLVNFYSIQEGYGKVGEELAFHLLYGDETSLDNTLLDVLPGLLHSGAEELAPVFNKTDPLGELIKLLESHRG